MLLISMAAEDLHLGDKIVCLWAVKNTFLFVIFLTVELIISIDPVLIGFKEFGLDLNFKWSLNPKDF